MHPPEHLAVANLAARYGPAGSTVFTDMDFVLPPGRCLALVGPSGCGKSTLLHVLAGLVPPHRGRITYGAETPPDLRGRVSYMQQKDLLLPWRTVEDNAALGLIMQGASKTAARHMVRDQLPSFGLAEAAQMYPHHLSGGMRQRAALLRTLLCRKPVLLLDEPFGALDAITRRNMHGQLEQVWRALGASVILVTHDVEEALILADTVVVLTPCPARILANMQVDIPRPRCVTDAAFIEHKQFLLDHLTPRSPAACAAIS
ncbi:MAG: ABC transporter ATP-binding protein [Thermodesulfobacteriota bacterium]